MILEILYIVLMILWALSIIPGTFLGSNGQYVGLGVQFVLFVIVGLVLFSVRL